MYLYSGGKSISFSISRNCPRIVLPQLHQFGWRRKKMMTWLSPRAQKSLDGRHLMLAADAVTQMNVEF